MKNYNIKVSLTEREIEFINAMRKEEIYGKGTFHEYLISIFALQLREDMDVYEEELLGKWDE